MQGWEEQGPRAVSFHGHAEVTRNRGLEWDNWWVGREVVDQRGLEEPKQAWGQGAEVRTHEHICVSPVHGSTCRTAYPGTQLCIHRGLDGSDKMDWATCS